MATRSDRDPPSAAPQTTQGGPFPQTLAGPDVINLGLGQPSPRLLPLPLVHQAAAARLGPGADPLVLQYGTVPGYEGFREALAQLLTTRYRHPVLASQLLVTGGISSALAFTSQLLRPGRPIVCSDPTYFLARGIFESQGLPVVGVEVDDRGLRVDLIERRLVDDGLRPGLVYCMPSYHNPTGVTLDPDRARRLVELAETYDFLVVADEPYVLLHYDDEPPPCMMRYDQGRGRVLSLGSFSKILGPGLRLGWVHAAEPLVERFSMHGALRSGGGLNPVVSSIVHGVIETGALATHIDHLRETFAGRADALAQALRRALPGVPFFAPRGGYFLWLPLPEGTDTSALLEAAAEHGVGFTPGPRCAVERDLRRALRLSVSFYEIHELQVGVERLASLLRARGVRIDASDDAR